MTQHLGDYNQPRPGFVEWYENGVVYTVFGDNIPMAKLIKIAESMTDVLSNNSSKNNIPTTSKNKAYLMGSILFNC